MKELELSDGRIVRIWWLLAWRFTAGAVIGGFVLSIPVAYGVSLLNATLGHVVVEPRYVMSLIEGLWWFFWIFIVIKMMLRKRYKGFRLAIVTNEPAVATKSVAPSAQPEP